MGIRTPVWALRGPRPGPLDDGGIRAEKTWSSFSRSQSEAGEIVPYAFLKGNEACGIVSLRKLIVNQILFWFEDIYIPFLA